MKSRFETCLKTQIGLIFQLPSILSHNNMLFPFHLMMLSFLLWLNATSMQTGLFSLPFHFQQIPKWVKMANESAVKFPESSFNASMYAFAWIWELYIVTNNSKNLFYDLATHWTGE